MLYIVLLRLNPGLWRLTAEACWLHQLFSPFGAVQPGILQAAMCSCRAPSPTVWHDIITVGWLLLRTSLAIQF